MEGMTVSEIKWAIIVMNPVTRSFQDPGFRFDSREEGQQLIDAMVGDCRTARGYYYIMAVVGEDFLDPNPGE